MKHIYKFLDYFFFVFHTLLILFILTGWIWSATLKLHLAVILLTAFSWLVIGIWKGLGYCICTDLHWNVRKKLGFEPGKSYIHFLVFKITGINFPQSLVDKVSNYGLVVCAILSILMNLLKWL